MIVNDVSVRKPVQGVPHLSPEMTWDCFQLPQKIIIGNGWKTIFVSKN